MQTINACIITIGDELLIGQTVDTNSAFISSELNSIGVWVRRKIAVGDLAADIRQVLDEESKSADIIIMTGGLGPTADDITKPLLCDYFGGKLVVDEKVLHHVEYLFKNIFRRAGPMLERNIKQAEVPDNCIVLHNERGTAPGMLFQKDDKVYISLPGVPNEMRGLMVKQVIPRIKEMFSLPAIVHRTAFTMGQGESYLAELLKDFESNLPASIKLAYLPNYGMVKLRLTTTGSNKEELERIVEPYFQKLMEVVEEFLVSDKDESLEKVLGQILKERGSTVATAESCTGGFIAHLITRIPGSSAYYKGSIVSYANDVKRDLLNVKSETLENFGAVSEETIKEMAVGAMKSLKSDYVVATSGIMGPDGGSLEKPVGLVWIAVGNHESIETKQYNFRFDRERNIQTTAFTALNMLRKFILAKTD